jgi:predicted unusual protein kinase regulating ubiquinone biosynthesis (AarF/ABC1/UbiB family)
MTSSQLRVRYWRIVAFFARLTASFVLWEIVLPRLGLRRWSRRRRLQRHRRAAVRFRALAIRLGGLMIKVGQFLSARLDVLPPEITDELAGLQDEVPPVEFEALRASAETELGRPLAETFAWIDPVPLAAASLGQVHRARLFPEDAQALGFGDVVVKVQRPAIEQVVEVDLAALRRVGKWLQRYRPVSRRADVGALVEEFATTAREEIDYLAEGSNAETFAAHFVDVPHVHVPVVVWKLTTRRVLTLEDVAAIKISDHDAITAAGIDRADVAHVLFETYVQQILHDGFFHADPHPGNLFVTPADPGPASGGGRNWRLTFVDFGMVGRVPEHLRAGIRELFVAVMLQDGPRVVRSFTTLGVLLRGADLAQIEAASIQLFERFGGLAVGDLKDIDPAQFAGFGLQFQELLLDLPFQVPENLLLLGRSASLLSGMCTGLDPKFNVWEAITPYAMEFLGEDSSTSQVVRDEATRLFQLALTLPGRVDRVLMQAERGDLAVRTPRLDLRIGRLERALNRQTTGIVGGAFLVSGAIVRAGDHRLSDVLLVVAVVLCLRALVAGRGRRHPGL